MRLRTSGWLLAALSILLFAEPTIAHASRWEIVPGEGHSEVIFHSKATMESFDGKTDRIRGWLEVNPKALADSAAWNVEVELASLDTGIGLRNTHMRENHLHTDEYPLAVFRGGGLEELSARELVPGEELRLTLVGEFELHGVTRERKIPVRVQMRDDGTLVVFAEFMVSLEEHEISRPRFLVMKLADEQRIEMRFEARPVEAGE